MPLSIEGVLKRLQDLATSIDPMRVAVANEDSELTYSRLMQCVQALASCFRRVDRKNLIILLALPSGPDFTAVQLAALTAGAITVPVPPSITKYELERVLALVDPDAAVVESVAKAKDLIESLASDAVIVSASPKDARGMGRRFRILSDLVEQADHVELSPKGGGNFPNGTWLIQLTSGSTGRPKGILLSHDNLCANLEANKAYLSEFAGKNVFCPMPQFHAFAGTVTLEQLFVGASAYLSKAHMPGSDYKRMLAMDCHSLQSSPTYVKTLLRFEEIDARQLPNLESIVLGTAPSDREVIRLIRERFPSVCIHIRYGLTETFGPIAMQAIRPADDYLPGVVGRPLSGVELSDELRAADIERHDPVEVRIRSRIVAAGQIVAREQWQALTDAEGYFSTGDVGATDRNGRLHLKGRLSTFIKRGGFRIDPLEIELVLKEMAGVMDAVVIGVPSAELGQETVAVVESQDGTHAPKISDVMAHCRRHLAASKCPGRIEIMRELPRTPNGKPDRTRIGQLLSARI